MTTGYSLHLGLNNVDGNKYTGHYPTLKNAENDAAFYQKIATERGYVSKLLIGGDASGTALIENLAVFAEKMKAGDQLFITYSGHGTRVKDLNGDEDDGYDEAMVLFDRLVIDDELSICWAKFTAGVKIFFINDSCFNGTVSRFMSNFGSLVEYYTPRNISRGIDRETAVPDFERNINMYRDIQFTLAPKILCSVLHIGSCQDNQVSDDGSGDNGYFTSVIKTIYESGFSGSYKGFFNQLILKMPPWQTPSWDTLAGLADPGFENSKFLVIL